MQGGGFRRKGVGSGVGGWRLGLLEPSPSVLPLDLSSGSLSLKAIHLSVVTNRRLALWHLHICSERERNAHGIRGAVNLICSHQSVAVTISVVAGSHSLVFAHFTNVPKACRSPSSTRRRAWRSHLIAATVPVSWSRKFQILGRAYS